MKKAIMISLVVCYLIGIHTASACLGSSSASPPATTPKPTECCDATAKEYACKLLKLHSKRNLALWKQHASKVMDSAYAYNNVNDTCAGKKASLSKYTCPECWNPGAPGGRVCVIGNVMEYIYNLCTKVGWIHVNEIAGACHSCKSKHYLGRAVDIHKKTSNEKLIPSSTVSKVCKDLGGTFINESRHYHCHFN